MGPIFLPEFQLQVLRYLLVDKDFLAQFNTLIRPEFFSNPFSRVVVNLVLEFFAKYNAPITRTALIHELKNINPARLAKEGIDLDVVRAEFKKLYQEPTVDRQYIRDVLVEFCRNESFKIFTLECSERIVKGETNPEVLGEMRHKMDDVINLGKHTTDLGVDLFDPIYMEKVFADLRAGGMRGATIATGIEYLDKCMEGGLGKPEMGVVLGPTGRGKTMLMVNFGVAALKQGKTVFHYTLEMPQNKVLLRYATAMLHVHYYKLTDYEKDLQAKLKIIKEEFKNSLKVKYLPYQGASVSDVLNHVNLVSSSEGRKPDLIILDYGDIMRPAYAAAKHRERRHEKGSIFTEVNSLTNELDVACWIGSQCNRNSVSKPIVTMTDIAESFEPVQVAPVVLTICQTPEEERVLQARLFLAKMREAEDHKLIYVNMVKEKMLITWDKDRQESEEMPAGGAEFNEDDYATDDFQLFEDIKL